jgi:hypothetical protein
MRIFSRGAVTTQTSPIIKIRNFNQGLVRVMTRNASQTIIALSSPAAALFQTVRLEANIEGAICSLRFNNVHAGPMASPAEINQIHWAEMRRIQNGL